MLKRNELPKCMRALPATDGDYSALGQLAIERGVPPVMKWRYVWRALSGPQLYITHNRARKLIAKWRRELKSLGISQQAA